VNTPWCFYDEIKNGSIFGRNAGSKFACPFQGSHRLLPKPVIQSLEAVRLPFACHVLLQ
jgi:hypothetical protein